eukprot:1279733-Pleurochrysis_carterae.AAC.1
MEFHGQAAPAPTPALHFMQGAMPQPQGYGAQHAPLLHTNTCPPHTLSQLVAPPCTYAMPPHGHAMHQ